MREGKVTKALRFLSPAKKAGPWTILCDNESFLRAKESMAAYASKKIKLWDLPRQEPGSESRRNVLGMVPQEIAQYGFG